MIVFSIFIGFIYVNGCSSLLANILHNITIYGVKKETCGVDRLPNKREYEGSAVIESFPWLGLLIYPIDSPSRTTTAVVLITRQIALAAALDIDYYPKNDFRARSRVVVGTNCSGPLIRVLDYTFHPDFTHTTYNTLALVQLDTTKHKVFPVCPPPVEFNTADEIYAMSMVHDCYNTSRVKIYKMEHVDETQCRNFYKKIGMDIESMWPNHVVCARGLKGGHCIWRSGTALVIRDDGDWKLLGVGTYGPGCQSPARFLDYSMYKLWVKRNIARIGRPTITTIGPDHIILRRATTTLQRYGPCDSEEMKLEIFSDRASFEPPYNLEYDQMATAIYNVTLIENVDYHCIILQVWNKHDHGVTNQPSITVRRFCANNEPFCAELAMQTVFFYVEIKFRYTCSFKVTVFGADIKYVNAKSLLLHDEDNKRDILDFSLNDTQKERKKTHSMPLKRMKYLQHNKTVGI